MKNFPYKPTKSELLIMIKMGSDRSVASVNPCIPFDENEASSFDFVTIYSVQHLKDCIDYAFRTAYLDLKMMDVDFNQKKTIYFNGAVVELMKNDISLGHLGTKTKSSKKVGWHRVISFS